MTIINHGAPAMTQPLSPAAQSAIDAVASSMEGGFISPEFIVYEARKVAAALRAVADQVECIDPDDNAFAAGYDTAVGDLLAIAAELEKT